MPNTIPPKPFKNPPLKNPSKAWEQHEKLIQSFIAADPDLVKPVFQHPYQEWKGERHV